MDEFVFLYKNGALTRLKKEYVPLPEPGPPSTKIIYVGVGGHTLT